MVLPAEGERDGDEPDHGCDECEEPRLCHAVIEELDPDEGIAEKPQVVVPREKQDEADESASRVVERISFRLRRIRDSFLGCHIGSLGPCRTVGNAFRFVLRRRKRAKARKTHF